MYEREILVEIAIPRLWDVSLCIRWKWNWKPWFRQSSWHWNVEWLCFDIAGRK